MRVGTVSSYLFREPREGATGCHCVPGTSDDGTRDEKKTNGEINYEGGSTGGKKERERA